MLTHKSLEMVGEEGSKDLIGQKSNVRTHALIGNM
jgi:hypothetical protein